MASGYVSNKSTYYSCRAKRGKNVHSKPHDELIQVQHKSFDEKVWLGLTELLSDPKKLKAQLEKRMQAKQVQLPPSRSTVEFDKELTQLDEQEKRILDAYRVKVISLDDLKEQKDKISNRRKVIEVKKKAALSHTESIGQPKITMTMLGDVSARFQRVMAKADFANREKLANLLVNSVTLFTSKAIVKGNIPVSKLDALIPTPQRRGESSCWKHDNRWSSVHSIKVISLPQGVDDYLIPPNDDLALASPFIKLSGERSIVKLLTVVFAASCGFIYFRQREYDLASLIGALGNIVL